MSFSCQSDAGIKGWQESQLIKKLNIQPYKTFPISVRFFYRESEPDKSRVEIRTPLLPGATMLAGAALKQEPQVDGLFRFALELQNISFPLDGKFLRYTFKGKLLLKQREPDQPYFVLERHGDLELGGLEQSDGAEALVADIEFFAEQIFAHRILTDTQTDDILPLVADHLDDVLTAYFFPEVLNPEQQGLLGKEEKAELQERYQIEFRNPYQWSAAYSDAIFLQPRFRQLRNSGELWQQFQQHRNALKILYNLRYKNNLAIPGANVLEREILEKDS